MKYLFIVTIFCLAIGSVFSSNSESLSSGDTIFAKISATSANDTIIAYGNNPWFVILDVRTPRYP